MNAFYCGLMLQPRNVTQHEWLPELEKDFGEKVRRFTRFLYAAGTWDRERRIIAKIEHGPKGANPRFVVTNLEGEPHLPT